MAAPYIKDYNGYDWEITDDTGVVIATVESEHVADCVLYALLNAAAMNDLLPPGGYPEGEELGEREGDEDE